MSVNDGDVHEYATRDANGAPVVYVLTDDGRRDLVGTLLRAPPVCFERESEGSWRITHCGFASTLRRAPRH